MNNQSFSASFFTVGGTLNRKAGSYIARPADQELLNKVNAGEYCNVLTARQMGKSSLMVRTSEALKNNHTHAVIIDLTSIGTGVTADEWYFGLITRLNRGLNIDNNIQDWWKKRDQQSPVQRFSDFLREVILEEIKEPIVVFLDEIDSTLQLPFTDDFFAVIRSAFNARAEDPEFNRLTFVLLGVARPNDLIKDKTRTPYNIGYNIRMTDFQLDELDTYQAYLDSIYPGQGKEILTWVLDWTGGQPYLTQKLCSETANLFESTIKKTDIDQLVHENFLGEKARTETNIRSIADRILASMQLKDILDVYKKVIGGKTIRIEEHSLTHNELKLCGIISVDAQENLIPRNRIYSTVFNKSWVKANLPKSNNLRITVISIVVAVIALSVSLYFIINQKAQEIEVQAQLYEDGFTNSESVEVRLTNLAGLFGLGEKYSTTAQDLFNGLSADEQLALFQLTEPGNVANELVVVIDGLYQQVEDDENGNRILQAMLDILSQVSTPSAVELQIEIEYWIQARSLVAEEQLSAAVAMYDRAYERSQARNHENFTVLFERGTVQSSTGNYEEALNDFEVIIGNDQNLLNKVTESILSDPDLEDYFRNHQAEFPSIQNAIEEKIGTPTPENQITSTPAARISEKDDMVMAYVPAGNFWIGSNYTANSSPGHEVYLDAYWLDQTEVTNEMFAKFLNESGNKGPDGEMWFSYGVYGHDPQIELVGANWLPDQGKENFPVFEVTWYGAQAYCEWAGKRLPTEAEWEKAAHGEHFQSYPWGDTNPYGLANVSNAIGSTTEVGSYSPDGDSPYGVQDMVGNVQEWVFDWYDENYYSASDNDVNPYGPATGTGKVVRGGTFVDWQPDTTGRNWFEPNYSAGDTGFRCALSSQ